MPHRYKNAIMFINVYVTISLIHEIINSTCSQNIVLGAVLCPQIMLSQQRDNSKLLLNMFNLENVTFYKM